MENIQKLKIVLLGNSGVGKTSLINQYVNKKFHHKRTLDFKDVLNKEVEMDGKRAILQIQDTGGQERLGSGMEATFFSNAQGCMLVYDVNDPTSLDNLENWHHEFITRVISPADPQSFPFIVIGNKVDLDGGKIRGVPERARMWCQSKGPIYHLLTSAKENKNVVDAFQHIAHLAISYVTTNFPQEHQRTKVEHYGNVTPDEQEPPESKIEEHINCLVSNYPQAPNGHILEKIKPQYLEISPQNEYNTPNGSSKVLNNNVQPDTICCTFM